MFKRNWLLLAAAFGIAIVGAILLIGKTQEPKCADILQELSAGSPPEESNNTNHSSSVTCERDCQVTFFRRHEADHEADAKEKRSNTYCDTAEELDLLAQKQMAHWTFYIALLTGAGVLLLIGTLAEAQRTNQAFTDASLRDLRAYVSYTKATAKNTVGKLGTTSITYKNVGQTPAYNLNHEASLVLVRGDGTEIEVFETQACSAGITLGPSVGRTIHLEANFPDWYNKAPWEERKEAAHLGIKLRISYTDFSGKPRITNVAVMTEKTLVGDRANRALPIVYMPNADQSAT